MSSTAPGQGPVQWRCNGGYHQDFLITHESAGDKMPGVAGGLPMSVRAIAFAAKEQAHPRAVKAFSPS